MRLKKNADLTGFIKEAEKTKGEVVYHSKTGDTLDLKSKLSQFIFAAGKHDGEILCADAGDYERLGAYLQEE